ncbi:MAG: NAD-dependent malic enzyme [Deltaproteobacteria bacterium]|nr:NAD-dependent malic enzyme [Deltaproteobacteria bacterium]
MTIKCHKGIDLLHDPLLNKGTAFTKKERKAFGLEGLLPPRVVLLEEQVARVYENLRRKSSNLGKYIELRMLQDRNEVLFYALVQKYLEEMIPIIYTPTVGEAVQLHSHIYRFARGLYISPENVRQMKEMAKNLPTGDIELIVVTDNQGILGIGDQGIGGMGIPIGKLSLYTLGAGIHPSRCLPISLDVGTDNETLLKDPFYLGIKQKRITGKKYAAFIDTFVRNIQKLYPKALVQWEDLSKQNAFYNLEHYRDTLLSFNDDIQGTGAVAAAGLLNACKIKKERFQDQIFCIYGAGAGGIGVATQILNSLIDEGVPHKEALRKIFVLDSKGLLMEGAPLEDYKKPFAKSLPGREGGAPYQVGDVVKKMKVTALLGLSGKAGAFTRDIAEAMLCNTSRPVIFPLSNPTANAEANPNDLMQWTNGAAIVATGSPFEGFGQGNNVFIFPGVGLGALAAGAKKITDAMFTAAARRLSELVSKGELDRGSIYPPMKNLRSVCVEVAMAVSGKSKKEIVKRMWEPKYTAL